MDWERSNSNPRLKHAISCYSKIGINMKRSDYRATYNKVVNLLVDARRQKGVTQKTLAECLASPQSYVSKYENGGRHLDVVEFLRIAYALDVNRHKLIDAILAADSGLPRRHRKRVKA